MNTHHVFRVKYEYVKPFILFPKAWNNFNASYRNEDNLYKFADLKEDLMIKLYVVERLFNWLP